MAGATAVLATLSEGGAAVSDILNQAGAVGHIVGSVLHGIKGLISTIGNSGTDPLAPGTAANIASFSTSISAVAKLLGTSLGVSTSASDWQRMNKEQCRDNLVRAMESLKSAHIAFQKRITARSSREAELVSASNRGAPHSRLLEHLALSPSSSALPTLSPAQIQNNLVSGSTDASKVLTYLQALAARVPDFRDCDPDDKDIQSVPLVPFIGAPVFMSASIVPTAGPLLMDGFGVNQSANVEGSAAAQANSDFYSDLLGLASVYVPGVVFSITGGLQNHSFVETSTSPVPTFATLAGTKVRFVGTPTITMPGLSGSLVTSTWTTTFGVMVPQEHLVTRKAGTEARRTADIEFLQYGMTNADDDISSLADLGNRALPQGVCVFVDFPVAEDQIMGLLRNGNVRLSGTIVSAMPLIYNEESVDQVFRLSLIHI